MSDTVTLTRAEYQDLVDTRDHAIAMRDVATGAMETLTDAELDAFLQAPSPLAYWRKRRGLTQAVMATTVGITQPYLAQIERGSRGGDVVLYAKLAKALRVRIEDLVADAEPSGPWDERWSPKIGQVVKLGLPVCEDGPDDGQTEAAFG